MKVSLTNYVIWGASFILQVVTAALIYRRRQIRNFPVFFAYTIFHLIQGVLSYAAFKVSYTVYFFEWWTGELLDIFLSLAVIQEIFLVTFRPYEALRRWGNRTYIAGTILLGASAIFMGVQHPGGYSPKVSALLTLDRSANFVQVGLLIFLFVFCRVFGMTWRHYSFGIACGFVVMASLTLVMEALRTYFGSAIDRLTTIIGNSAFTLGIMIWTYYFVSIKSRVELDHVPGTEKLIAWNRALGEIGRTVQPDL